MATSSRRAMPRTSSASITATTRSARGTGITPWPRPRSRPATSGQWVFLAGVYDGTQWDLYRDGVLVGTSGATTQGALPVSTTNWAIGAAGSGTERFFQGEIDDVSIWNVGRSAAQVQSDMSAALTPTESGLVADYLFDETSGTTALDATANRNNGTLGGSNPADAPTRVAGIVLGPTVTITPGTPARRRSPWWRSTLSAATGVRTATLHRDPGPHHGQCRRQRRGPAGHALYPHRLVHRSLG